MNALSGRTAVVTGAASGIGFALAHRFALGEGMKVVLADVEPDALDAAAARLTVAGGDVIAVVTDVSDGESVEALAAEAVRRFGAVHVVCNNAGVGGHQYPAWESPLGYWEWVLSVNLWGVINGVRAFMPRLVEQDEGHMVNTASIAGLIGAPFEAPYVASKHAVVGLSATLAQELAAIGSQVKVSVLCPGPVATRFSDAERNWPQQLGTNLPPSNDARAQHLHDNVASMLSTNGLAPERVADLVADAIHNERFMILTDPRHSAVVLTLLTQCLEGQDLLPLQRLQRDAEHDA